MTLLFLVWAYYQLNDSDALLWVMVYLVAVASCVLYIVDRLPAIVPVVYGGLCVLWAAYLSVQFTWAPPLVLIEQWREMMGLLIIAVWMGVLAWHAWKRKLSFAGTVLSS